MDLTKLTVKIISVMKEPVKGRNKIESLKTEKLQVKTRGIEFSRTNHLSFVIIRKGLKLISKFYL